MSCSPLIAWITEPAPRNSSALKKAWVNRWNIAARVGRHAGGEEHVAELRAGRIGDDPLDVVLRHADAGGEDRRGAADHADDGERGRRVFEHRRQPRHHEDAGGHHRRGVDQGRDRGRALHRVGQPGVQAELRRFPHRADEQQDAGERQRRHLPAEEVDRRADRRRRLAEHRVEIERAEDHEHREDAERKAEIADPVDDKGLDRGVVRRFAVVPEADQQVGAEPDAFPAEEQLHEVVGRHQHQHEEGEQAQIGHEARDARIMRHVADRIDVDHRRDDGHDEDHHARQRVEPQRPVDIDAAGDDPGGERHDLRAARAQDLAEQRDAERPPTATARRR